MAVNEARISVTMRDGASAGLRNIGKAAESMNSSILSSGRAMGSFSAQISRVSTHQNRFIGGLQGIATESQMAARSMESLNKLITRLVYSMARYTVIYQGIQGLASAFNTVIGGAYEFQKSMEQNAVGISGILTSMYDLDGATLKWGDAMKISNGILKDLSSEALRTTATTQDLLETFRALLGPGTGAGMTIKQIEHLSVVGTNAVKSLGLPSNQIIQELRDLVQGGIRPASSTLATALGLKDADIKAAKASSEGLYNFLIKRLKGFEIATDETNKTVFGRLEQMKEGLQRVVAGGTEGLYNDFSDTLKGIADRLIVVNKQTHAWEVNPDLIKDVKGVSDEIRNVVKSLRDIGSNELVQTFAKGIAGGIGGVLKDVGDNIKLLTGLFVAMKAVDLTRGLFSGEGLIGRQIANANEFLTGKNAREQARLNGMANANLKADIFSATLAGNSEEADNLKRLVGFLNEADNSVNNLAKHWIDMGMNAEQATKRASEVMGALSHGFTESAELLMRKYDAEAKTIQEINARIEEQARREAEYSAKKNELYASELKKVQDLSSAYIGLGNDITSSFSRGVSALKAYGKELKASMSSEWGPGIGGKINRFMEETTTVKTKEGKEYERHVKPEWQRNAVKDIQKQLFELKDATGQYELSTEEANRFTIAFIETMRTGMKETVPQMTEKLMGLAKAYMEIKVKAQNTVTALSEAQISNKLFMVDPTQSEYSKNAVKELSAELEKSGLNAKQSAEFINQYVMAAKRLKEAGQLENPIATIQLDTVKQGIIGKANEYAQRLRQIQEEERKVAEAEQKRVEISHRLQLEASALHNAYSKGGEKAYQAVKKLIDGEKELTKYMKDRGVATDQVESNMLNYLAKVTDATDELTIKQLSNNKAMEKAINGAKDLASEHENGWQKASRYANGIQAIAFSVTAVTELLKGATDENDEWVNSMASGAMAITGVTFAVSSLIDGLQSLFPVIKSAIGWFKALGIAKGFALGGIGAAVTAIAYGAYEKWRDYLDNPEKFAENFARDNPDISEADEGRFKFSVEDPKSKLLRGLSQSQKNNRDAYLLQAPQSGPSLEDVAIDTNKLQIKKFDNATEAPSGGTAKMPKMPTMPKTYNVEVPIGEFIVSQIENGLFGAESEQWRGRLGNDIDGWCADWASTVYSSFETGIGNVGGVDSLSEEFGHAYHEYNPNTFNPKAGDLIKWSHHVGIADGKGGYWARNSRGGVTHGTDILAPQNEGNYGQLMGYGSIGELTGNAQRTMTVGDSDKKALEYKNKIYAEVAKIVEATRELNRETAEINETESAYDKTMGEAYKKLNAMQTEVAKGQKMKIDTTALEKAMEEYRKASIKKATQDQQDYNLQMMGLEESRINNLHSLGLATTREQAEQLSVRLANHKAYLEDLLADENLSAKRRYKLEKQLSDVMKQQNDERRYDAQKAWYDHMSDIANSRSDYKSLWENITGGIQDAFVEVLTSTESFSARMKNLFKSLVSNILSNLARLAVNQLFQRLLGGYNSLTNRANISSAANVQRGQAAMDYANSINLAFGKHANGGYVSGGDWTMVGENGPELVRFNKGGMVYNNTTTNSMSKPIVNVVVNNNTGSNMRATTKESQDGQGRTITTVILETVTNAMVTNEGGMRDVVAAVR